MKSKLRYVRRIPRTLRPNEIIVHNHVRPQSDESKTLGVNGFRAWIDSYDQEKHARCHCDFAGLNPYGHPHYRIRSVGMSNE
jgi:hypothetical protein